MTTLQRLQHWLQRNYNDTWDHGEAISIETLDDPGWAVRVDLRGTTLEQTPLAESKVEHSADDWTVIRRTATSFEARGGLGNLEDLLVAFLDWADEG